MMVLNMDIHGKRVFVKQDLSENNRLSCMYMGKKRDASVQTNDFDITNTIAIIVESRLNKIQKFETEELKDKLSRIEEENRNLKRRENILEKRLVELENKNKKRKEICRQKDDVIVNKRRAVGEKEPVLSSETNGKEKEKNTDMINKEFCPTLFKPAEVAKSNVANINTREKLTQMVTPMQKPSSVSKLSPHPLMDSRPSSMTVDSRPAVVATTTSSTTSFPPVPALNPDNSAAKAVMAPAQVVYATSIGNKEIIQIPYSMTGRQIQTYKRPPPPPPNVNITEYMPLSKPFRFQQYHGPPDAPPRLHLQPQVRHPIMNFGPTVSIALQPPQRMPPPPPQPAPPPAYNDSMNMVRLPQLTATITSDATNVILTWDCFNATAQYQCNVQSYLLFAYHTVDLNTPPPPAVSAWKRIGIIKALPLPVACTLTQTFTGHNYYFAVAALDNRGILGPLSNACTLKVAL